MLQNQKMFIKSSVFIISLQHLPICHKSPLMVRYQCVSSSNSPSTLMISILCYNYARSIFRHCLGNWTISNFNATGLIIILYGQWFNMECKQRMSFVTPISYLSLTKMFLTAINKSSNWGTCIDCLNPIRKKLLPY